MIERKLWDQSHPGIYIEGRESFFTATSNAINKLRSRPIGKDLISNLSKRCKIANVSVVIKRAHGSLTKSAEETSAGPDAMTAFKTGKKLPGTKIEIAGKGSGSEAFYNPDAEAIYTQLVGITTPAYIALGHELIHSMHHLSGGIRLGAGATLNEQFEAMYLQEEAHTVGLGPYKNTRISENALRKEWNLPLRTYYSDPNDCDALPSLAA